MVAYKSRRACEKDFHSSVVSEQFITRSEGLQKTANTEHWPLFAVLVMQICIILKRAKGDAMATLTVTARGQVTFRKEVLQHLGVKPGEKIALDLLPGGRGELRAAQPKGRIEDLFGCLAGKTKVHLTIDEINEGIGEAAAEAGMAGLKR
jgi:bifunctional DNA-binding transcriptional regulator/antitoxin component of YhaV-PrlF toxin-antitoxin module